MSDSQAKITEDQVRHVAKLSRLELTEQQLRQFTGQLRDVLAAVEKLDELDVENVEPMAHAMDLTNVLREDAERASLSVDEALANAPDRETPFFKVPKVIGEGSA